MIFFMIFLLWGLFADWEAYSRALFLGATPRWWAIIPGGGFVLLHLHRWENSI